MPDTRKIVTLVGTAGCVALLQGQSAHAQLPDPRWWGEVACTITTAGTNYTDQEVDTWSIGPIPMFVSSQGATTNYSDTWTVTGSGSSADADWTIDGKANGVIGFRTDSNNMLHIALGNSQLRDNTGILVTPHSGNPYYYNAYEEQFAPIIVPATQTYVQGSSMPTVSGTVGFQQAKDATSTEVCSWNLHFGLVWNIPVRLLTPWWLGLRLH